MSSLAAPRWSDLKLAARDIKLAHSVFALPFAILASFLARSELDTWGNFGAQLGIVVLCMVTARTWAMMVNRIADRDVDALNPRTARRAVASGSLHLGTSRAIALASAVLFVGACSLFWIVFANPWPTLLSLPVLGFIALYSYTKRFTALCHIVLGAALAASPLAAGIAIDPGALGLPVKPLADFTFGPPTAPAIFYLAGMVLPWVAGFDIIYALQDIDFDRSRGLHSVPAALGASGALWVSRLLHVAAFAMLLLARTSDGRFGLVFTLALAPVGALLVLEHVILARKGPAGLNMAFFTINGIVSCVLGAAGCLDTLL
jgi:4-hydroxybenzoate polyprenyltransferase